MPVIGLRNINGYQNNRFNNLTHIYFKNPSTIRVLSDICYLTNLKVFKFPVGLRIIRGSESMYGFRNNQNLQFDAEGFAACRLTRVEAMNCFTGSFTVVEGQIPLFQLPGTLQYINKYAFSSLGYVTAKPPAGQYRIVEVSFGGPNDPSQLNIDSISSDANLFYQQTLSSAPTDEGASTNTPIKTFTYYKDPTVEYPDINAFRNFVEGEKVTGSNDTVNIQIL